MGHIVGKSAALDTDRRYHFRVWMGGEIDPSPTDPPHRPRALFLAWQKDGVHKVADRQFLDPLLPPWSSDFCPRRKTGDPDIPGGRGIERWLYCQKARARNCGRTGSQ